MAEHSRSSSADSDYEESSVVHSSDYDLNDEILPAGVAFLVQAVRAELPEP